MTDFAATLPAVIIAPIAWIFGILMFGLAHVWITCFGLRYNPRESNSFRQNFRKSVEDLNLFIFSASVAGALVSICVINIVYQTYGLFRGLIMWVCMFMALGFSIIGASLWSKFGATWGNRSNDDGDFDNNKATLDSIILAIMVILLGAFWEIFIRL